MYAVIKTGGKQYRVAAGEKIKIEQIPADVGTEITLDQILMVGEGESVKIGAPLVVGASVIDTTRRQALWWSTRGGWQYHCAPARH